MSTSSHFNQEIRQARHAVRDLFEPRPHIYWLDFGLSITFAHGIAASLILLPISFWWANAGRIALFVFALAAGSLLYYRSLLFIHELAHLRSRRKMAWFRLCWNVLCGIPLLAPSFVFFTHHDHHRRKHYGTKNDAEYLPYEHAPRFWMIIGLLQGIVAPLAALIRFYLVTPLCWTSAKLRRFVNKHASSLSMNPTYLRPTGTAEDERVMYQQEIACFAWCVIVTVLLCTVLSSYAVPFLACTYFFLFATVTLNQLRTLGAHRYTNVENEMTFSEQVEDSLTYPYTPWVTELWGPVGLRFHALHHMFPSLPYHALPEAHRRVMEDLPAGSFYSQTIRRSLLAELYTLWKRAGEVEEKYGVLEFFRSRKARQQTQPKAP